MKNLLLLLLIATGINAISQKTGEVVFYSNTGEKFYVVLNGVRQNQQAETNVKVTGLNSPWYGCKIISGNNSFELEKTFR
ncbi:MAG: hypothetical protein IPG07_06875 [Crocinitomicaceae bacterium]|nr:hypothetical protein [Crocinitomicaceae bacterium]